MQIVVRNTIEFAGYVRLDRGHHALDDCTSRLVLGASRTACENDDAQGNKGMSFHVFGFR
jgi:hypothetical protein